MTLHTETAILQRRSTDDEMAKRMKESGGAMLLHAAGMARDRGRDLQDSGHLYALMILQIDDQLPREDDSRWVEEFAEIRYWVERAKALFPPGFPAHDDVHLLDAE